MFINFPTHSSRFVKSCLIALLFILTSATLSKDLELRINNIDVRKGLSNNTVMSIIQDNRGYLWIGTETGLNLYDGYNLKVYRYSADDTNSLNSNGIVYMFIDNKNDLWILNQGIDKYDSEHDKFLRMKLKTNSSTSMTQDKEGNYWFEANGEGLYKYSENLRKYKYYSHLTGSGSRLKVHGEINDFLVDDDNTIWLATEKMGLIKYNEKARELKHFQYEKNNKLSLPHNEVLSLYKYNDNMLWIGTRHGISILDISSNKLSKISNARYEKILSEKAINSMVEDARHRVWISTDFGLYMYNKKTNNYQEFVHDDYNPYSLSVNNLSKLYFDKQGILWIGTRRGGVNFGSLNTTPFVHNFRKAGKGKNTITSNLILSMYHDSKGVLWLGTEGEGLNRIDRKAGSYKSYYHNPKDKTSINGNTAQAIFEDSKGNLWIGMYGNGLSKYNRRTDTFTSYLTSQSFLKGRSKDNVMDIFEDSRGDIWIATNGGGLILLDPINRQHKRYLKDNKDPESIANDYCITVSEDSFGKLWIGTYAGLSMYNPQTGKFKNYYKDINDPNSLSSFWIYSILEDSKKNLWIGTSDGLNLYNREQDNFTHFGIDEGLPNYVINGILEDENGNLWISTNHGLSMFNTKGLKLARNYPNALRNKFSNYDVSDGLQAFEFNVGVYCKSKDGEMFFGGINGYNSFYPGKITENEYVPPVYISNFLISHTPVNINEADSPIKKHISYLDEIDLNYEQSTLTFEFVALNYINSEKNKYAYYMEGLDDNWIYGTERKVTYNKLGPGDYTFHVKGSNNSDVWNEKGVSLKVYIAPPFWATWWFRLLMTAFLSSLVILLYNRRVLKITEQRKLLKRQVAMRTSELNFRNKEISLAKKEVDDILENVKEGLFLIDKNFFIESHYSKALEKILVETNLAKKSFIEYFDDKLDEKIVYNIEEYLELLFTSDTDDETLHQLNPLHQIKLNFNSSTGVYQKFLTFDFGRIMDNNKIARVIASVYDITDKIHLEQNLKQTKKDNREKMERLFKVLSIEPSMLKEFVESTKEELSILNKAFADNNNLAPEILDSVFRSVHAIKGNSSLLGLTFFAEQTHYFEDVIAEIRERKQFNSKDTKIIKFNIVQLNDIYEEIKNLIQKLGSFNDHFQNEISKEGNAFVRSLTTFTQEMAVESGVIVKLNTENFKNNLIPAKFQLTIRDILIQMIRNSVYHGIEPETERQKKNKSSVGNIEIQSYELGDSILIKIEDDGRGLQLDKLREKAKSMGQWSEDEINNWDDQKVFEIIFAPGISTADKVDVNAGRGVGMDIIKNKLANVSGTIRIDSQQGHYCQFVIEVPKVDLYDTITEKITAN